MNCRVCKKEIDNIVRGNSIVCSDRCDRVRIRIIKLSNKYTPTNGCENCWGDLHIGCTDKCKEEFEQAGEFIKQLYELVSY